MKKSLRWSISGFVVAVGLLFSPVMADEQFIPVPDGGFEDHVLSDPSDWTYVADSTLTAWKSDAGSGGAWIDWNYYGDWGPRTGNNKVNGYFDTGSDYIYQILDETFIAGKAYTLSVWVSLGWGGYDDGWWLYFTKEDYTKNLCEASGKAPVGTWEQVSLVYTATAADAGKKIGIKLRADMYVTFDDVTLSYGPPVARNPDPADGATRVRIPLLRWTTGGTAIFHDLYLGTSPELTEADRVATRLQLSMNYYLADLVPGTTYYWRVDEIEPSGTVLTGQVWSFTTAPLTAYDPSPRDGVRGLDPAAVQLSWTPGDTAESHDVYFGTVRDDVANGTGDAFKGNQIALTFDLGELQENTTYYWRIDEVGSAEVKYAGQVWSFTTISPTDGVKADYFNGITVSGAPVLTRTERTIDHSWGAGEVVAGLSDTVSARWTAILEPFASGAYTLITTSDDGVRLWLDGRLIINNWTDHGATDNRAEVKLVAGNTYLVVMEWYENAGDAAARLSWEGPAIAREILPAGALQLPVRAAAPYPGHKTGQVPQDVVLHWTASKEATHHDVYFGDSAEAVANADTITAGIYQGRQPAAETSFDPGSLEWGKTYFWRVDEINPANPDSPWKGAVWSFTTADFVVVDDFERYTNDVGGRLFQTWLDGYGYTEPQVVKGNGTGAVVGHDVWSTSSPDYAGTIVETRVVHSGLQSMPLDYNNVNEPYYSEATRTWASLQDWTVNGVNTLVLYFKGGKVTKSASSPEGLYVAVTDNANHPAVIAHPDPGALSLVEWQQWRIPLADFTAAGVNVTKVKQMGVGVGNRKSPKAGGAGLVYIDDIRVVKPAATN